MHVGWSGNHRHVRRAPARRATPCSAAASCCCPARSRSAPGESYSTPVALRLRTASGSTAVARRFHALPAGPAEHPRTPAAGRAQHLGGRLLRPRPRPADRRWPTRPPRSASSGSCSTTAGSAAAATTPPGSATGTSTRTSGPTACTRWSTTCRGSGMQFGLWVEPEMVNPDSDLARAHPDWILAAGGRLPPPCAPPAGARPRPARRRTPTSWSGSTRCSTEYRHRLPQVGPQPRPASRPATHGRAPGVHAQTAGGLPAARRAARAGTPALEIESLLVRRRPGRPRRSWSAPTGSGPATASTRWSGSRSSAGPGCCCRRSWSARHVGPPRAHTTGRTHDLSFRAGTALFGHFGIEWDLAARHAGGARRAGRAGSRCYKELRAAAAHRRRSSAPTTVPTASLRPRRGRAGRSATRVFAPSQLDAVGHLGRRPGPAARPRPAARPTASAQTRDTRTRVAAGTAWSADRGSVELNGAALASVGVLAPGAVARERDLRWM